MAGTGDAWRWRLRVHERGGGQRGGGQRVLGGVAAMADGGVAAAGRRGVAAAGRRGLPTATVAGGGVAPARHPRPPGAVAAEGGGVADSQDRVWPSGAGRRIGFTVDV